MLVPGLARPETSLTRTRGRNLRRDQGTVKSFDSYQRTPG